MLSWHRNYSAIQHQAWKHRTDLAQQCRAHFRRGCKEIKLEELKIRSLLKPERSYW